MKKFFNYVLITFMIITLLLSINMVLGVISEPPQNQSYIINQYDGRGARITPLQNMSKINVTRHEDSTVLRARIFNSTTSVYATTTTIINGVFFFDENVILYENQSYFLITDNSGSSYTLSYNNIEQINNTYNNITWETRFSVSGGGSSILYEGEYGMANIKSIGYEPYSYDCINNYSLITQACIGNAKLILWYDTNDCSQLIDFPESNGTYQVCYEIINITGIMTKEDKKDLTNSLYSIAISIFSIGIIFIAYKMRNEE